MRLKKFLLVISIFFGSILFHSCGCSCTCEKNSGCRVIVVRLLSNDSIIKRTFCSQVDLYTDTVVQNSVEAFFTEYQSISEILTNKDSVYKSETVQNLTCDQSKPYAADSFKCWCAK